MSAGILLAATAQIEAIGNVAAADDDDDNESLHWYNNNASG